MKAKIILTILIFFGIAIYAVNYQCSKTKEYRAIECAGVLSEAEYNIVKEQENLKIDYSTAKSKYDQGVKKTNDFIKYQSICEKVDSILYL